MKRHLLLGSNKKLNQKDIKAVVDEANVPQSSSKWKFAGPVFRIV